MLLIWSVYGEKATNFPCGEVCACSGNQQQSFPGLVADCSGRNLKNLPVRLPQNTKYLDLSSNAISTLSSQQVTDLPRNLLVLNLLDNPIDCEDAILKQLAASITLKSNCGQISNVAVESDLHFPHSEESKIGSRTKRAVASCQAGSANCVNYTCGGIDHWLPYQTYWGCCKGVIHDQRETYCSEIQGVMQCGTVAPAFRCRNEHCIPNPWLCNRVNDCQDGSDELGCDECNKTDNFRCWNGRCIPQSAVCDAYNDCGDGSDETFCRTLRGGWCTTKQYRCPTDSCVPLQNVCDGKADCTDNSDEIGCIVTCNNGWKHYQSSCYKYSNHHRRWTDAEDICQRDGAHLAKITSRKEQDFVFSLGVHQPFQIWIGLRAQGPSGKFTWADGSPLGNFTFWSAGEPSPDPDVCAEMIRNDSQGRWQTGPCTTRHSSYVCEKERACNITGASGDCKTDFETPPLMKSFPREEIISAQYETSVTVQCEASGIPRPTVTFLINGVNSYAENKGHTIMEPYKTTVTYVVTMPSDVECHISNRMGNTFWRIKVNLKDDDPSFFKAVLRLTDETFTSDLKDPLSEKFKTLSAWLENILMSLYTEVHGFRDAEVVRFRNGSVVADVLLTAAKGGSSVVQNKLLEVMGSNQLQNVTVDSFGVVKACPKEFFNVSWSGTFEGEFATQNCPRGAAGVAKRKCLNDGVWGYPDYGECISQEFNQLQEKMNGLFNSSNPSTENITAIITELSSLTQPKKYDSLMAGNIKTSTQILQNVVFYNKKFANSRETVSTNIEGFLQTVSNLLHTNNLRDFQQLQETDNTTTDLTRIIEDYGLQAASGQKNDRLSVVKDNIAMETRLVPDNVQEPLMFPNHSDYKDGILSSPAWTEGGRQFIKLPEEIFNRQNHPSTNGTKVASFLFRTLTPFLSQESAYEQFDQRSGVVSRIIASSVQPPVVKLQNPVVINFVGIQENQSTAICVYWDYNINSRGGGWSKDGCELASHRNDTVTCECNHLTNFAVLMDPSGISSKHSVHQKTLGYITVVGCSLSLLGIIVTLILHGVLWRILKSHKTVIHVNLCIALLAANVLLLIGAVSTEYEVTCKVISVLLHFFYLSAIFWMLVEGLQIYSSIVKVFGGESKQRYFYFLGWGFPLLYVAICLVITRTEGYGVDETCWLSITSGLIWTFIAPTLAVVSVNCIIFVLVLRAMMTSHKMIGAQDKEKIKLGIKCSIVLLPLLGITWVFGVLAFDQATVVFLYLFAIFNSLQGFFIFIFHCLFDQQVRSAMMIWKGKRQRAAHASGVDATQKSKPVSCSLTTERLPSHGVRMTDLSIKKNNQNYRRSGEMNGNFT